MATGCTDFSHTLGEVILPGFDDLGVLIAFAFELSFEQLQEVVNDLRGHGLNALAAFAGSPSLVFVELLFLLVEGLFNVPA